MKSLREASALLVVLSCAACGPSSTVPADFVALATTSPDVVGCPANRIDGVLAPDQRAGVAIVSSDRTLAVIWPSGFTGHRVGDAVEIIDQAGVVVARTGETVALAGGELSQDAWTSCGAPMSRHADRWRSLGATS